MDITRQLVRDTEGKHGEDIRGWNGEAARLAAEEYERQQYAEWMALYGTRTSDEET